MMDDRISAIDLLDKYGPQLSQQLLCDMLEHTDDPAARDQIEKAIDDLETLIQTDEKGLLLTSKKIAEPSLKRLPPVFTRDCLEIWLFDNAIVTFNKIASHYHGYYKKDGKTVRLSREDLELYRVLINYPQKLLYD